LLKEKFSWHLDGNHTTEQCYQLRRALKGTPEPPHPHDKKGKKKHDGGNADFSVDCPADGNKRLPVEKL
jgi:hypothetical protein